MFRAADLMLLNKIDLLPHLAFDAQRAAEYARRVNPALQVMRVSAATGEGFDDWLAWIDRAAATRAPSAEVQALQRRVAELEARLASRAG
jgi:hydrogenase nickel incorporation protein HypB